MKDLEIQLNAKADTESAKNRMNVLQANITAQNTNKANEPFLLASN